jgi:uncharacterized damage-inducible protein DinB
MLDDLRRWFRYHLWANRALRAAAAELPADALHRELGGSFGTLGKTFEHMLGADWLWLERFQGRTPRAVPAAPDPTSMASLGERYAEVERGQIAVLDALTEADLARTLAYTNLAGVASAYPLGDTLRQVFNHGTYHRGQIVMQLRLLGAAAPSTDFLRFLDAERVG